MHLFQELRTVRFPCPVAHRKFKYCSESALHINSPQHHCVMKSFSMSQKPLLTFA